MVIKSISGIENTPQQFAEQNAIKNVTITQNMHGGALDTQISTTIRR